jgi:hypothetical protein
MKMVKEMDLDNREEWSDSCRGDRPDFLKTRMKESISDHLSSLPEGMSDRRNSSYQRRVLTGIGDLPLRYRGHKPMSPSISLKNL